jgi:AcrR family transcriptional regulator
MPYPAQMDAQKIIDKAWAMLEAQGIENLSLHKLAEALGVKAPSLYRHFGSKNDLLRAINIRGGEQLQEAIRTAVESAPDDPRAKVSALATAYRTFAHANPMVYFLMFNTASPDIQPEAEMREQLALPLQQLIAQISGEADSLPALRGLWALMHGFATLEINGQFRRGDNLERAFHLAVEHYIAGWTSHPR